MAIHNAGAAQNDETVNAAGTGASGFGDGDAGRALNGAALAHKLAAMAATAIS